MCVLYVNSSYTELKNIYIIIIIHCVRLGGAERTPEDVPAEIMGLSALEISYTSWSRTWDPKQPHSAWSLSLALALQLAQFGN